MNILLIDNYDSFTWNLFHYLEPLCKRVKVVRNDDPACLETRGFHGIVISPGPGLPEDSGFTMEVIRRNAAEKPVLGVCLGHQAIVMHYGGQLVNLTRVLHGKSRETTIVLKNSPLFAGLPQKIRTGHYHSWVAERSSMPGVLDISAEDQDGLIMACQHKTLPVAGVQFHPESILTPCGMDIIRNWTGVCRDFIKAKQ